MASSSTTVVSIPSTTGSVTAPFETTTTGINNEGKGHVRTENNSSSAYLYRLSCDIPHIPDIPSPLLRPPTSGHTTAAGVTQCVTAESSANLPYSSASVTSNGHGKYGGMKSHNILKTIL